MPITYPQSVNYLPHQMAMLAGVNKRQPLLSEHSTLKSRLGSVVDLEEKKEVEARRRLLQSNIRELINRNLTAIRKFFRDADPYQTGYVSQRQFRETLSLLNIPIEAAIFSTTGMWHEEREVHTIDGIEGRRPGPFKEHLMWIQDPIGAKDVADIAHGHVKYMDWLNNILQPEDEVNKELAISTVASNAGELYELWRLVCASKHQLLTDLWPYDKEKMGYVKTDDFHYVLQSSLQITKEQASLLLGAIPFEGKSGFIAYRRWMAEFVRSPRIGWQNYLNMNLLASGSRELDMDHASRAAAIRAKMEKEAREHIQQEEKTLQQDHRSWLQEQVMNPINHRPW